MKRTWMIALTALLLHGCGDGAPPAPPGAADASAPVAPVVVLTETRNAYFGDLHVHTSWSTDAYSGMNRVGPAEAYRFARGEAVELPGGFETQLATPLDFVAITDHAEGFDAIEACTYPENAQYSSAYCENMRNPQRTQADYLRTAFERGVARPAKRQPDLCADEPRCLANAAATWRRAQAVANEYDDPGRFTALIGYEFSSLLRDFGMLHRNVIFRGTEVIPHAISSLDVSGQAEFFAELDANCQAPCQVLTIPHNTNYSWGLTFSRTDEDGSAFSGADIERRMRLDRLVEVTQQKGTSECQLGVGAADEDCNFGILFPPCEADQFGRCARPASFVRNALLDGVKLSSEGQQNIFKLGMIGSTDTHQSDPGNTDAEKPSRYRAAMGNAEAVASVFRAVHPVVGPMRLTSSSGLAGVWARANTREEIFDALRRRETFATSGSRLKVRFFGGNLPEDIANRPDGLDVAYASGVPMGSELAGGTMPRFWVSAMQDPLGASLDRVQVVKGWIEDGETRQQVRDVACSGDRVPDKSGRCPASAATVDLATCARSDTPAASLSAVFEDMEYDAGQWAFYYVRVLENPSCRWTTWLANSAGIAPPDDVPATIANRGWSSPIWIAPVTP